MIQDGIQNLSDNNNYSQKKKAQNKTNKEPATQASKEDAIGNTFLVQPVYNKGPFISFP